MYYFPINVFLVSFQGFESCITRHGPEQQSAAVSFLAAHVGLPWSCFSNPEDEPCHAWAGTPRWESEGVLPIQAGGSFCHRTEICFHSSVYWLQHCISAAFEQRKKPNESNGFAVAQSWWPMLGRLLLHAVFAVTYLHTHTLALAATRVLRHFLGEDHARAKAWPAAHIPALSTPAFHKFIWAGSNVELTESQWLHMEICWKLQMCLSPF